MEQQSTSSRESGNYDPSDRFMASLGGLPGVERAAYRSVEQGLVRLLTLASALLGLSVTFRSNLMGANPRGTWLLLTSWIALSLCVLLCVRIYFVVAEVLVHMVAVKAVTAGIRSGEMDKAVNDLAQAPAQVVPTLDTISSWFQDLAGRFKPGLTRSDLRKHLANAPPNMEPALDDAVRTLRDAQARAGDVLGALRRAQQSGREFPSAMRTAFTMMNCIWSLFSIGVIGLAAFGALNLR